MFKAARPGTGEDWSEKLVEQFALRLGIPHARYQLARWRGERGIITPRLTSDLERLVHGNELLIELNSDSGTASTEYRTPRHTASAVIQALEEHQVSIPHGWSPPGGIENCLDVFAGYLLLDALVGNTDRHHENWAAVERQSTVDQEPRLYLSPTFDHASSLGRNEPEGRVVQRLTTRDAGFTVEAYARRAPSAFYPNADQSRPLTPLAAFGEMAHARPAGAAAWCSRLKELERAEIVSILSAVPDSIMKAPVKEFVARFVFYNREELLEVCSKI